MASNISKNFSNVELGLIESVGLIQTLLYIMLTLLMLMNLSLLTFAHREREFPLEHNILIERVICANEFLIKNKYYCQLF